jgi:holin-like protein
MEVRRMRDHWLRQGEFIGSSIIPFVKKCSGIALQLLTLLSLNFSGQFIVRDLHLPIPGTLVGIAGMFLLLWSGAVKLSWFDETGSFLMKHLAFFFIPVTVGLIDAGALLATSGIAIAVVLGVSAAVGIALSGLVCQRFFQKRRFVEEVR